MFIPVFCMLLLFSPSLSLANNVEQLNDTFSKKFNKSFDQHLKKHNIPGGAYAIVQKGKIVSLESFGHTDKAKSQPINSNTVFRLASVSKTFAATITTMLAQGQQLNLSDPITKYVPHFKLAKEGAAHKIQLKHLLSHSSGLMPNAYDNLLHENWSMNKIINRFDRITPICQPEKCYSYQNIVYAMLQPAIEASQNKSYAATLQELIFTPLNMTNASVGIDAYKSQENTAKPHILKKRIKTSNKDEHDCYIKKNIWRTVKVEPDFGTDQIMGIRVPIDIVPQQLSKAKLCLYFYRF
jgi:beta-lactamase class C